MKVKSQITFHIPQLAKVNPDLFGISVCDVKGNRFSVGDAEIKFCLQSCCKPILYCIARDSRCDEHVGHEPSGQKFNAFVMNEENKPYIPMINAGAIMTSNMIKSDEEPAQRFYFIKKYLSDMTGGIGNFAFDNSVFLSERTHYSRNRALAYFIPEDTNI